jgi:hypothetical protein
MTCILGSLDGEWLHTLLCFKPVNDTCPLLLGCKWLLYLTVLSLLIVLVFGSSVCE